MKITVCELPNQRSRLESAWSRLAEHVSTSASDVVLLPEMPFYRWLSQSRKVDPDEWRRAVAAHDEWIGRLDELSPATVLSTRPSIDDGTPLNVGFFWEPGRGMVDIHAKYYLPDEPGFWEASWYRRGNRDFDLAHTSKASIGFLICTELWFAQHARAYGQQGAQIIVCPRATPTATAPKWIAGGQAAAVISGAFCLSSNLAGTTEEGGDFAGVGWIIHPEEGEILGLTSSDNPFLTVDIDLASADDAKASYPRYVVD
jgi:N-carbamoylputrescine amidase